MNNDGDIRRARLQAFLLDWLIWAYIPAAGLYFFQDRISESPFVVWLYVGALALGLFLALILESRGISIGERVSGLAPEEPLEERGRERRTPWHRTQVGWTGVLLAVVTLVLGWQVTEINLYYVFTRADRMQNMTDRLLRPYWPVFGSLIEKLIETIFLALMATVISIPLAVVVSFFAARNIMYRLTVKWGKLVTAFVLAVLGGWVASTLVGRILGVFEGTRLDVKLLSGILTPLCWLIAVLSLAYLGSRLFGRIERAGGPAPRVASIVSSGLLGLGAAYIAASFASMFLFAASWRIFVRDWGAWPYLVLVLGAGAGVAYGLRQDPFGEFPAGRLVYAVVRFALNATRSIEPFVWALIFVTWFRLGPFPGMVALMVHSIAALGKLYSEQIESIDPGPVEAVRATGANELQTVVYAIIPQIIPPFISFTIYRWDINVRMSTIIGLVGGGGIGQMLFQFQNLGQWRKTSVAVVLIVAVVMTLDSISARIRQRIL